MNLQIVGYVGEVKQLIPVGHVLEVIGDIAYYNGEEYGTEKQLNRRYKTQRTNRPSTN